MGTSCNYGGGPKWASVKNAVTRTSGGGHLTPSKAANVVNSFVRQLGATGGLGSTGIIARGETGSGAAGGGGGSRGGGGGGQRGGGRRGGGHGVSGSGAASAAQRVGDFVSDVREHGLRDALRNLGMESCEDRTPAEIASFLADALGGPASTIDAVALRAALCDVIENLIQEASDLDAVEGNFSAAADNVEQIIRDLFGFYIVERFATIMTAPIDEKQGVDVTDAYLGEIRAYVDTRLQLLELERPLSTLDWRGVEGAATVDDILVRTQAVFGGAHED